MSVDRVMALSGDPYCSAPSRDKLRSPRAAGARVEDTSVEKLGHLLSRQFPHSGVPRVPDGIGTGTRGDQSTPDAVRTASGGHPGRERRV